MSPTSSGKGRARARDSVTQSEKLVEVRLLPLFASACLQLLKDAEIAAAPDAAEGLATLRQAMQEALLRWTRGL